MEAKLRSRQDLVQEHYAKVTLQEEMPGFDSYLDKIDSWISNEFGSSGNLPLLIVGESGSGKSTLITQWMRFHSIYRKRDNDYVVYHFSCLNPSDKHYVSTLNRLYNIIRDHYELKEAIELTEDSLRTNFSRILSIANNSRYETHPDQKNLVLIIDGIDKYVDDYNNEELAVWLPLTQPSNVKLIYTCTPNTKSYRYLSAKITNEINIKPLSVNNRRKVHERYTKNESNEMKEFFTQSKPCGNCLYLHMALEYMLARSEDPQKAFTALRAAETPEELFDKIIDKEIKKIKQGALLLVLGLLGITRTGLSIEEICGASNVPMPTVSKVLKAFSFFILDSGGFYLLKYTGLRDRLLQRLPDHVSLHYRIIKVVEKQVITIRKIEELLYNLKRSGNWMRLKDQVADLETFLLLMLPQYQSELLHYWKKAVEHKFDPVNEYNRTFDFFISQYKPTSKQIFFIAVQLCRFFRMFGHFESPQTCEFRHPIFTGENEIREVCLLQEALSLEDMFSKELISPIKPEEQLKADNKLNLEKFLVEKRSHSYFYKRWLWISFPWCSMDPRSDFSLVMKEFNTGGRFANFLGETNAVISVINFTRIASDKTTNKQKSISRPQSESNIRIRKRPTRSLFGKQQNAPLEDNIDDISIISNKNPHFAFDESAIKAPSERKLKLEGTPIDQIIDFLSTEISSYAKEQLQTVKNDYFKLISMYNQTIIEKKGKVAQLEAIKTQLCDPRKEEKEKASVKNHAQATLSKLSALQDKIEQMEVENSRLLQIIQFANKNPAKNDMWQKGLETVLKNICDSISSQSSTVKSYADEVSHIKGEYKTMKSVKKDMKKSRGDTINRVKNHVGFRDRLKSLVIKGKKRRTKAFSMNEKETAKYYKSQIISRKQMSCKKTMEITFLKTKLKRYNQSLEPLKLEKMPDYILSVLDHVMINYDLKDRQEVYKQKIEEQNVEKKTLLIKLKYLKKRGKEAPDQEYQMKNFEDMTIKDIEINNRFEFYHNNSNSLRYKIIKTLGQLENIWKKLGIKEEFDVNMNNVPKIFETLSNKIAECNAKVSTRKISDHSETPIGAPEPNASSYSVNGTYYPRNKPRKKTTKP